jgi:hypothetical protein
MRLQWPPTGTTLHLSVGFANILLLQAFRAIHENT